jgi:hypothetical protein
MSKAHQKQFNGELDVIPFIARSMANDTRTQAALESLSRQDWFGQLEEFREREKRYGGYCRGAKLEVVHAFRKAVRLLMAAGYDKENQSRAEKEVQNLIERGWPDLYHFVTTSTDPLGFDAFCILKRDKDRRTGFQSGKFKDLQKKEVESLVRQAIKSQKGPSFRVHVTDAEEKEGEKEGTEEKKKEEKKIVHVKPQLRVPDWLRERDEASVSNGEFCLFLYSASVLAHKKIQDQTPRFARHFKKCGIEQSMLIS